MKVSQAQRNYALQEISKIIADKAKAECALLGEEPNTEHTLHEKCSLFLDGKAVYNGYYDRNEIRNYSFPETPRIKKAKKDHALWRAKYTEITNKWKTVKDDATQQIMLGDAEEMLNIIKTIKAM